MSRLRAGLAFAVLAVGGAACGDGGGIEASWREDKTACDSPALVIPFEEKPGTKLRWVSTGPTKTTIEKEIGDRGLRLLLTWDKIGDAKTLEFELETDGNKRTVNVSVPSRPARQLTQPQFVERGERGDWSGRAEVTMGGKVEQSYEPKNDADKDGRIALSLPCGLNKATSDAGRVEYWFNGPVLVVDAKTRLLDATGDNEADESYTVAIEDDHGNKGEVRFTGKLRAAGLLSELFAGVADGGLEFAPAREDGSLTPALILYDGKADFDHLGGARARDAVVVGLVAVQNMAMPDCTYAGDTGGVSSVRRIRPDTVATLYEAKTGTQLATKTFKGKSPECPKAVLVTTLDGVEVDKDVNTVRGEARADAARKWIERKLR